MNLLRKKLTSLLIILTLFMGLFFGITLPVAAETAQDNSFVQELGALIPGFDYDVFMSRLVQEHAGKVDVKLQFSDAFGAVLPPEFAQLLEDLVFNITYYEPEKDPQDLKNRYIIHAHMANPATSDQTLDFKAYSHDGLNMVLDLPGLLDKPLLLDAAKMEESVGEAGAPQISVQDMGQLIQALQQSVQQMTSHFTSTEEATTELTVGDLTETLQVTTSVMSKADTQAALQEFIQSIRDRDEFALLRTSIEIAAKQEEPDEEITAEEALDELLEEAAEESGDLSFELKKYTDDNAANRGFSLLAKNEAEAEAFELKCYHLMEADTGKVASLLQIVSYDDEDPAVDIPVFTLTSQVQPDADGAYQGDFSVDVYTEGRLIDGTLKNIKINPTDNTGFGEVTLTIHTTTTDSQYVTIDPDDPDYVVPDEDADSTEPQYRIETTEVPQDLGLTLLFNLQAQDQGQLTVTITPDLEYAEQNVALTLTLSPLEATEKVIPQELPGDYYDVSDLDDLEDTIDTDELEERVGMIIQSFLDYPTETTTAD